jgi:hypothetical protein
MRDLMHAHTRDLIHAADRVRATLCSGGATAARPQAVGGR